MPYSQPYYFVLFQERLVHPCERDDYRSERKNGFGYLFAPTSYHSPAMYLMLWAGARHPSFAQRGNSVLLALDYSLSIVDIVLVC